MEKERKHHIAVYNGREVVMDYIENPKEEFKFAAMRIQDNLPRGGVGYVLTPDGKTYRIEKGVRMAKLVTSK